MSASSVVPEGGLNGTESFLLVASILSLAGADKRARGREGVRQDYSASNLEELRKYYNDAKLENVSFKLPEAFAGAEEFLTTGGGRKRTTTTKRPRRSTTKKPGAGRTTTTDSGDVSVTSTTMGELSVTRPGENSGGTDLAPVDVTWILLSAFIIFTMQTGFGLLEGGIVSPKNETNILMKNVVDVVLGGFSYWIFGYGITYGTWKGSSPFFGVGYYAVDADIEEMGDLFTSFFFQLSFATTATTIVSGALAERCNFKAYCLYSLLATITYSVQARWVWGPTGFLGELGAIDIAGSGSVHLVGGSAAFVAAWMLGPRLGRYDTGMGAPPVGNNTSALLGLFNLWWGWLAFNAGSTFGMTGNKWKFAARAATATIIASLGGGLVGLVWGYAKPGKTIEALDFINPILGALVGVTGGCALYHTPEAFATGVIGGIVVIVAGYFPDLLKIDDPVGATAVHGFGGIWGLLAVGVFGEDDEGILGVSKGHSGFFRGGDLYLVGIQALTAVCLVSWSLVSTFFILWVTYNVKVSPEEELMGLDFCEHGVRRSKIGATPALSLFGSQPEVIAINNAITGTTGQNNPGHEIITETLRDVRLSEKRKRTKSGQKRTLKGAALFARAFQKIKTKGNRITPRDRQYIFDEYMSVLKSSSDSIRYEQSRNHGNVQKEPVNRYQRAKRYFRRKSHAEDTLVRKSLEQSTKMGLDAENERNELFYSSQNNKRISSQKKSRFSRKDSIPTYGYLR